ncbi:MULTISPECIES: ester cyclase [unclassified Streptomyces]|uniref:ester cyclase n=1 Tax=unclassified Streptomyces TaxID=2593676 RepID=UPI00202F3641|nr:MULTISPECIES: ester cyclase [unclassified Streptomyces]MCM1971848.1 ester cyclase [Streptomyces sp. G1]MCX5130283.1 ester cyclase [Streptomyces sp. NBC_00347]MCX5301665.1 ester cyclase [Streptomyces sp. NBC_00193]
MSIQETVRSAVSVEERNKKTIRAVFDTFVNRGDFSIVEEIYSPDMIDHQPLPGAPEGLEGVKYTIAGLREGFPDLHVTIEDMSAHGDHVVIHNTWRGTHRGEFLGMPPTGRYIEFQGVVVWRLLDDGLIAERWGIGVESNMLSVLGMRRLAPSARGAARAAARRTVEPATVLLPLPEGGAARWKDVQAEFSGPRLREYEASRRRAGILQESFALQRLGDRDVLVHRLEARDPAGAAKRLGQSRDAFDVWLREAAAEALGADPWESFAAEHAEHAGKTAEREHTWSSVTSELSSAA